MKSKRKTKNPELPPLCVAVKRVRLALKMSQEQFARRTDIAAMTISRFERGEKEPKGFETLKKLRAAADAMELAQDSGLFQDAINELQQQRSGVAFIELDPPKYTPLEWRLMQAIVVAARYAPEQARKAEEALRGMPLELVDSVLRAAKYSQWEPELMVALEHKLNLEAAFRGFRNLTEYLDEQYGPKEK